jgi:predicted nucleic acid-binding protein
MTDKFFLDTNIFVYSFDSRFPSKQKKAQNLIETALSKRNGLVSYQVIQEFINVALRKFEKPLTTHECRAYLDDVLWPLYEGSPSLSFYRRALELKHEMNIHFYDALIIASASEAGCKILYTEDLQNNQQIAGLTIQNPF